MRKINIQDLIQLLGMVGIIGSLIFVGLEMKQSLRIAMADQQMERTALSANRFAAYNEAGLDWHSVSLANRPVLADQYHPDIAAGRNNYHEFLYVFENDYFQFTQGLMPADVWRAKRDALFFNYNKCSYRELMELRKSFFPQGLVEVIDSLPDECPEEI